MAWISCEDRLRKDCSRKSNSARFDNRFVRFSLCSVSVVLLANGFESVQMELRIMFRLCWTSKDLCRAAERNRKAYCKRKHATLCLGWARNAAAWDLSDDGITRKIQNKRWLPTSKGEERKEREGEKEKRKVCKTGRCGREKDLLMEWRGHRDEREGNNKGDERESE